MYEELEKFINQRIEVNDKINSFRKELSKIDKELTDYCHLIEFAKLPANATSSIMKEYRIKLIRRREIKDFIEGYEKANTLNMKNLIEWYELMNDEEGSKKIYTVRTKEGKDIFNKYSKYIPDDVNIKYE